jgi:hypothetical protein
MIYHCLVFILTVLILFALMNFHNTLFLFQLDLDFLEQHATSFFKEDIVVGDQRHLLFYTDNQLDLLEYGWV